MNITITWQTVITTFAVISAIVGIIALFAKIVRWVDKQNTQDAELKALEKQHKEDIKHIKEEQTLLVEGILACLQGLQEKGCNGPVTQTINKYKEYLNQKAHE
jgi:hypothetical protein